MLWELWKGLQVSGWTLVFNAFVLVSCLRSRQMEIIATGYPCLPSQFLSIPLVNGWKKIIKPAYVCAVHTYKPIAKL